MFIHLHSHTEASIADGLFGPKKWVQAIKERGFKGHAITDHGVMTNAIPFYHLMRAEGLLPIMGCEFYYVDNPLDHTKENRKANHIILLAKNYEGFQALLELQKRSFSDGFYFRQRIGLDWIKELHGGNLICLTACLGGVLAREVFRRHNGEPSDLVGTYKSFQSVFKEDFYVEFQGHNFENQALVNETFFEDLRKEVGFKPIVTNDCHYILPEHARIQGSLKDMAYKKKSESAGQSFTECDSLWLKNAVQVYESFRVNHEYLPKEFVAEGMRNTGEVFEKCVNFELPTGKRYLPSYKTEDGTNSKEFFRKFTLQQLANLLKSGKLHGSPDEYKARYVEEFRVISKYGLEDYFLIVWDLVRFAKEKGIFVGVGRGSAAGCLISYLLGIVKIDPMEYGLMFERFLNEHRCDSGELPDIDLDFESKRREEIKDYIFETYGREKVCEIGTYGRMKLKTALLDFGKSMNAGTYQELLGITTEITELDAGLEEAMENYPKLKNLMIRRPDLAFVVDEINGQMKTQSVHPAGVLISSEKISHVTPLKTQKKTGTKDRVTVTQTEDKYVIAQGLVKMDILGLKEYDVIKFVLDHAPDCDYTVDDYVERIMKEEIGNKMVWKYFQAGLSQAVFQFASDGMQDLLVKMQPDQIGDLIAANALYRPGCLRNGWHIDYCDRKHGRQEVDYLHPIVEEITRDTYGILVYQEQVMAIINKLGGIPLADSDTIRSALGKKNLEKLSMFQPMFIKGASKHIGEEKATELWKQLLHSSEYNFNKSHSASYSVLAFISQVLKIKYPAYFWSGRLEWDALNGKHDDKLIHKRAAQEMGVEFLRPDINCSKREMIVEDGKIRWSLLSIKGIGEKTAMEIERHQPYDSFDDFYERVHKGKVKVNNIESLIYAGVFDSFGDRKEFIIELYTKKDKAVPSVTDEVLILKFSEAMGFFEQKLKEVHTNFSEECIEEKHLKVCVDGEHVRVGGMISEVRSHKTKKGDPMGFVTLIDLDERIEVTVFPETWAKFRRLLIKGSLMEIEGTKSVFGGKQNQIQASFFQSIS
jgi:DNA polymerase-3 subunit alpha